MKLKRVLIEISKNSTEIMYKGNTYYVEKSLLDDALTDSSIKQLFLYDDPDLTKVAKNKNGTTMMVKISNIESILREASNDPAQAVSNLFDLWALIKHQDDVDNIAMALKELRKANPKKMGIIGAKIETLYKELFKLA